MNRLQAHKAVEGDQLAAGAEEVGQIRVVGADDGVVSPSMFMNWDGQSMVGKRCLFHDP